MNEKEDHKDSGPRYWLNATDLYWKSNAFLLLLGYLVCFVSLAKFLYPSPEPSPTPTAINAPTPKAEREPPGAWICATLPGDCPYPGRLCCNGDLCQVEAAGKVWWCEVRDCQEETSKAREICEGVSHGQ